MLIDYVNSDVSVLALAARHVGSIYVLSTVLTEVDGLGEEDCDRLGLQVYEPQLSQLQAAAQKRGALSTQDHLCLILAQEEGWTCVTNDGALRRACGRHRVPVLWGLELMIELVQLGQLAEAEATAVAQLIHQANPFHITTAIVARFVQRLREATGGKA